MMKRSSTIAVAVLLLLAPVVAGAQEQPPIDFLGFTLGCDQVEAEQTAAASPSMARKAVPRSDRSTVWTSSVYSGNNVFRNAVTTTLVFHEKRLYSIRIRIPESPSRGPLAMFDAIRAALSKKYGTFEKPEPVSETETTSLLAAEHTKRRRMYIEIVSLSGTFVEIRAFHKAMKDRIIVEAEKKAAEDDLIDIDVF